jgi:hypothetical protein
VTTEVTDSMADPSLDQRAVALWRAARTPLIIGLIVITAGITLAVIAARPAPGPLNPDATDNTGSRAVAQLLRANGVTVTVTRTSREVAEAGAGTTVLVTFPDQLGNAQLRNVRRSASDLVLVAPSEAPLAVLAPEVTYSAGGPDSAREPGCDLPAARAAGAVELGVQRYRTTSGTSCYADEGGAALIQLTDRGRIVTVLGTPTPLTNGELATAGNEALVLRLLGAKPTVLWYLPAPEGPPQGAQRRTLSELVPRGWIWAAIQLAVAAVLAALWRARRLGAVVREPLPVVVRAVEVTEGHARLYRRAGARAHAADTLRAATRARLASLVGLGSTNTGRTDTFDGPAGDEPALLDAISARTGRPVNEVRALLYGPAPTNDLAMVALADQLDACEREVRRT